MRQPTRDFLASLEKIPWFARVRRPLPGLAVATHHLKDWIAAAATCADYKWERERVNATNALKAQLSKERLEQWDRLLDQIKPQVEAIVDTRVLPAAPLGYHKLLRKTVSWDLTHAALEHEFAPHLRTTFYRTVMIFYQAGHLPCGWIPTAKGGRTLFF